MIRREQIDALLFHNLYDGISASLQSNAIKKTVYSEIYRNVSDKVESTILGGLLYQVSSHIEKAKDWIN